MKLQLYILAFLICNVFFANAKSENKSPIFTISYNSPVYISSGNIIIPTITSNGILDPDGNLILLPPNAIFSSTVGLTIDPSTGEIDSGASLAGFYTVRLQVTSVYAVQTGITLLNDVPPTFNPITNICQNSVAPSLPNQSTNGVFGT